MNEPNLPEQVKTSVANQKTDGDSSPTIKTPKVIATQLTRSELIDAINSEIKQIEDENKRPGWSSWALQGGIATFVWLALADFSPKSNLQTIGIVFLFGSFFGDFLLLVCQYFNGLSNPERKQLRYRFSTDDPNISPAFIIFTLVRCGALLLIYLLLGSTFHVPTLSWFCEICIALCIIALPIRFIKILSLNKGLPNKSLHLLNWLLMTWIGFLSYQLFTKLPFSDAEYRIADFRVGFLLVGIVYLFWLLATGEKKRPIISVLKEIRRALAFGHLSVEEAAKDADTALSGLTATAAIEHQLTEISVKLQNVTFSYEKLIAECKIADLALRRLEVDGSQQDSKWREDARKVAILIDSCETKRIANQQLFNAAFYKTKSFLGSIERLNISNSMPKSELAPKWQDMKTKMEKMFELSKSTAPLLEDIKTRYKAISFADDLL